MEKKVYGFSGHDSEMQLNLSSNWYVVDLSIAQICIYTELIIYTPVHFSTDILVIHETFNI